MYGKWFLTVFAFGGAVLLIVGLMTAFPALAAVAIGLLLGFIVIYALAAKRTRQVGAEHATAAEERRDAGQAGRPSACVSGAAPAEACLACMHGRVSSDSALGRRSVDPRKERP